MTDNEIQDIALRVLNHRLKEFGFHGADVRSEVDFDGSPVVRVKARYTDENAPSKAITQSLNEIRSALLKMGEERFVLLEGELLGGEQIDEDVN
jgi:hypothetical protein